MYKIRSAELFLEKVGLARCFLDFTFEPNMQCLMSDLDLYSATSKR